MDILFYISGLLTSLLVGLVFASIHAYKKFKTLIEYSEFVNSEAEQRYNEMDVWKNRLEILVGKIQEDIENDGYESIAKVNNTVEILTNQLHNVKTEVSSFNKSVETSFTNVYTQITDLRQGIIPTTQDIDRY